MSSSASRSVYQQVVTISHTYLGPASERFIDRQIKNHLDKEPSDLQPSDIYQLIDWIRIAVSFLTEDSNLIEEYIHQLKQIANSSKQGDAK
jgi:hypothetical protein